ncbi:MAG: cellulase family glycosylhydrolase [Planctomycetes bacterium]|nr:cellulase family glycosylhydrolase [Planctomycetota bacterium]
MATISGCDASMGRIVVSPDARGFVKSPSGETFTPWGFNYDHDRNGRLIEDYWENEWATIEADFAEMKALGANVVRVHLQFGKFMEAPDRPNTALLGRLAKLVALAERTDLYLDVTGLGCYHKPDVPAWYDKLDESSRWQAQARFWEAVATTCASSRAIFCYDLMNEPVVAGGDTDRDDWLAGALGDKHFVQFITLAAHGRDRPTVARAWIDKLVAAIRRRDGKTMITVGLVPWSLDRPGLSSGFVPDKITGPLDFVAVHLYPEKDKLDAALDTLAGFDVGKPIVIEETFPLRCTREQMRAFLDASTKHAAGWISFYWGKTIDEYKHGSTINDAIIGDWLTEFAKGPPR